MLMLLLLLAFQDEEAFMPETINAQLFVDGQRLDLIDVRVKGIQPYTFEFRSSKSTQLVNLFQVASITRIPESRDYRILFLDGQEATGRIRSLSLTANPSETTGKRQSWLLQNVTRVHFVQGKQLRSCAKGHYEAFTPYPYCPVCGDALAMGPYHELKDSEPAVYPLNTLRQDSRDPSATAIRR